MKKSIYQYAAESGIPVGIYLCMMSGCLLLSIKYTMLGTLLFPLAIGFPLILGFMMKQIAKKEPEYLKIPALWLAGIYIVIFGSIICMLFSAAYITFANPGFVYEYVSAAIDTIENSPVKDQYANTAALMRDAIDARILPTGTEFVATMGWTTCFTGSLLSLLIAAIIVSINRKKQNGKSCAKSGYFS